MGLSLRSYGQDVGKQLRQVARGWMTSPVIAIVSSLAADGVMKSLFGL